MRLLAHLCLFLSCTLLSLRGEPRIETLAGTGQAGDAGDGGPATEALLNQPFGIVRGPDGCLYLCDTGNHTIRRIDPTGKISTFAGTGDAGYSGDGGPATKARLHEPYEVRFDAAGDCYFVEMKNHLIRKVSIKTGVISTVAGTGKPGFSGDGGPAIKAQFQQPHSIQFGPDGRLYVCDILNHRLRVIDLNTGLIDTLSGTGDKHLPKDGASFKGAPLLGPRAIDFDRDGTLWLALREGNAVYRLDLKDETIHHVAGTGKTGFTGNGGPAKDATLSGPKGIAIAPNGNVYLADTESHSVRYIDSITGQMKLLAGTGEVGDGPDGDPLACRMNRPHGIYVDTDGAVYIGDTNTHRVRVVRP